MASCSDFRESDVLVLMLNMSLLVRWASSGDPTAESEDVERRCDLDRGVVKRGVSPTTGTLIHKQIYNITDKN